VPRCVGVFDAAAAASSGLAFLSPRGVVAGDGDAAADGVGGGRSDATLSSRCFRASSETADLGSDEMTAEGRSEGGRPVSVGMEMGVGGWRTLVCFGLVCFGCSGDAGLALGTGAAVGAGVSVVAAGVAGVVVVVAAAGAVDGGAVSGADEVAMAGRATLAGNG